MSAPAIHSSSSSISSSGQADGLGRRVLTFDREGGGMLERLHLRPELAAFESALRGYIDRLAALEDERFVRPLSIERDPATGELTVVSPFISGTRLSDLLDLAQDAGAAPGVDVALGYLLEALPAISVFHAKTGMAHGLIDPARTVISPAGQIVFLDCAYGAAIERLGLSAARLWTELGIAAAPSSGPVRLDTTADLAQIAMTAVMLVYGRRLEQHEYPDALPSILMEIVEAAQIRRSSTFASALQRILQRSLPLPGRRAFKSADEAIVEVRQLVRREIGLDVCRQALLDFVAQMDAAALAEASEADGSPDGVPDFDALMADAGIQLVDEEGEQTDEGTGSIEDYEEEEDEVELELRLDGAASEPAFVPAARSHDDLADSTPDLIEIDDVFEIDGTSDVIVPPFSTLGSAPRARREETPRPPASEVFAEPEPQHLELEQERLAPELSYAATAYEPEPAAEPPAPPEPYFAKVESAPLPAPEPERLPEPKFEPKFEPKPEPTRTEAFVPAPAPEPPPPPAPPLPEPEPEPLAVAQASAPEVPAADLPQPAAPVAAAPPSPAAPAEPPVAAAPAPAVAEAPSGAEQQGDRSSETTGSDRAASAPVESTPADGTPAESTPAESTQASSRRKKRQQRSARARKDKLRSLATDQQIAGAKPATPPPAPKPTGWIVSPERAATFEPPVPEVPVPAPVAARPLVVPPPPTFPPPPLVVPPAPVTTTPVVPVFPAPPPVQPLPKPIVPAPAPAAPPVAAARPAVQPAQGPVRLKTEPPAGYTPVRKRLAPDPPVEERAYSPVPFSHMTHDDEGGRSFPWKLAAAAVVLIAIAIVVGRSYIPSRSGSDEAVEAATVAAGEEAPAAAASANASTGEIVIETQPAGARVLLNGRPVGESPLKIPSVTPGRHVITFVTSSGEFKRTVRVTAGQTLNLDVPLYSGWVAIFAPIILNVAENGRVIGNTEQNRLMLPPGPHKLTLSNRELGYSTVKEVEIQAGEVYSVTLDPRGPVNFNAVPWGEVWLDNQKLGDTPIAKFQVPLGIREFVFKHPQFGERRVTATVRADAPTAVSVDFTKP